MEKKNKEYPRVSILLCDGEKLGENKELCQAEQVYARQEYDNGADICFLPYPRRRILVFYPCKQKKLDERLESVRCLAARICDQVKQMEASHVEVIDMEWGKAHEVEAFMEGFLLSSYSFDDLRKKKTTKPDVSLQSTTLDKGSYDVLLRLVEEVNRSKRLIDMPFTMLNASALSQWAAKDIDDLGIRVNVWSQEAIEKAGMGGLLGVNRGSVDKPSFTEMEYCPEKPINKKPIVLVGKGVVFDAGGMNIKTGNYMDDMKTDMAGAALAMGIIRSVAFLKLPIHLYALLPATDNRLNGNALVCGDVITMYDGTTVEVVNTDAEGRLLLADAVAYASRKLKPELIVSMATLTGAASRALGSQGIAAMQEDADKYVPALMKAGDYTHERLCFFPMWKEYEEELKSQVADLKNCGNGPAGMVSAAKFVKYFAKAPFLHLDVAGVEFLSKKDGYRGPGATAFGIRLMVNFLRSLCE